MQKILSTAFLAISMCVLAGTLIVPQQAQADHHKAWISVAMSDYGDWGFGEADSPDAAEAIAIARCKSAETEGRDREYSSCADSVNNIRVRSYNHVVGIHCEDSDHHDAFLGASSNYSVAKRAAFRKALNTGYATHECNVEVEK